jgi:hypothetical protein
VLADGTHTITLTATSAAGAQASTSEHITIANEPPPPPTNLTASPAPSSDSYTVQWTDPQDQIAPIISATYEVCHNNEDPANCSTPATSSPEGPATVALPESGTWTIIVWLTNAAGNSNPANAARLTIPIAACCSTETHSEETPNPGPKPAPSGPASSTPKPQPKLHATATLRDRTLTIKITAPAGIVRAHYQLREPRHHPRSSKTRKAMLHNGHATITFKLSNPIRPPATLRIIIQSANDTISVTIDPGHR